MRIPLVLTGFNLVVALVALFLYFLVDPAASVTVLFVALAVHTSRPFLAVLDAVEEEGEAVAVSKEVTVLLARFSRDGLGARAPLPADPGASPLAGLLLHEFEPRWEAAPAEEREDLARALAEAGALLGQEAFSEALKRYRKIAKVLPAEPAIHHNLGVLYLVEGDLVRARASLLRALFFHPEDPRLYEALAEAAPGPLELAERAFRRARALVPEDPAPFYHLARFYIARGRPEEAEEVLERYLAEEPADPGAALCLRGWARLEDGRPADASRDFQAHLSRCPWSRTGRIGEGLAKLLAGNRKQADRAFGEAIELVKGSRSLADVEGALLGRALAAFAAGERERAIQLASGLREMVPEHRGAILVQSLAALDDACAGRSDPEGEASLGELRGLVSNDRPSPFLAYVLGRAHLLAGASAQAAGYLEAAVRDAPEGARERIGLAVAYLLSQRADRVPDLLEPMVEDATWGPRAETLRALARMIVGDGAGGREALGRLARSDSPEPFAFRALAAVHGQGGDLAARLLAFVRSSAGEVLPRPGVDELVSYLIHDAGNPLL